LLFVWTSVKPNLWALFEVFLYSPVQSCQTDHHQHVWHQFGPLCLHTDSSALQRSFTVGKTLSIHLLLVFGQLHDHLNGGCFQGEIALIGANQKLFSLYK
jgi:hypothetical protein